MKKIKMSSFELSKPQKLEEHIKLGSKEACNTIEKTSVLVNVMHQKCEYVWFVFSGMKYIEV